MERKSFVLWVVNIILIGIFSVTASVQQVAAEEVTLKGVTFLPRHLLSSASMENLKERVYERSKGELIIKFLGGPEVMAPHAQIEAVRTGRIDIVITSTERFEDIVPEVSAAYLSELTPMEERKNGAYEWFAKHIKEKLNVFYLGRASSNVGFWVHTNFPVEKVADLERKQIAARPTCYPFLKAVGAIPISVGKGDWYSAVERGVVDGYSLPLDSVLSWGLIKITKYTIDHGFYKASSPIFMVNLEKWNSLPYKHQDLMIKSATEIEAEAADFRGKKTDHARKKMEEGGVKFIRFSPVEKKKFIDLARGAAWAKYKESVTPETYAEARKLLTK